MKMGEIILKPLTILIIGCFYSVALLAAAPASPEISTKDNQEVLNLLSKHAYSWDSRDYKTWLSLFTDDAISRNYLAGKNIGTLSSNKQRLAMAKERLTYFESQGIQTRHFQTSTLLTRISEDTISGLTMFYVTWQHNNGSHPQIQHTGIYKDIYKKTIDGWKFSSREVHIDRKQIDNQPKN